MQSLYFLLLSIYYSFIVVHQYYEAEVLTEYIIKGNSAILKCNVPSFVADFVKVEAWVSSDGVEFVSNNDFGRLTLFLHRLYSILFPVSSP